MNTLDFILKKFNLSFDAEVKTPLPIEIPNYGRKQLAGLLRELDFKTSVEIGVAEGRYSKVLLDANPQMKLYGIDPFEGYRQYRDYTKLETFKNLRAEAQKRLAPYPNYEFIYELSADALGRFKDKSLDFVYIDGNHEFSYVASDITEWSRKVKTGGIIAGHDYARFKAPNFNHVWHVVNAYTVAWDIKPWFVLGANGVVEGQVRDSIRSWMWVKK